MLVALALFTLLAIIDGHIIKLSATIIKIKSYSLANEIGRTKAKNRKKNTKKPSGNRVTCTTNTGRCQTIIYSQRGQISFCILIVSSCHMTGHLNSIIFVVRHRFRPSEKAFKVLFSFAFQIFPHSFDFECSGCFIISNASE